MASLKKAGNDAFAGREYVKALDSYERALKVLPEEHAEAALLHSNKAACNMMLKKCAPTSILLPLIKHLMHLIV